MSDRLKRFLSGTTMTLLCLGVAATAGYYLYLDILDIDTSGNGKGIASLNKSVNSVKRRSSKSFLWKRAEAGQELHLKDSIQTSDDSAAAITLKSGQLIELGPNSLFVLNNSSDLSLSFLQGSIVVGENGQSFRYESDAKTGQLKKVALPASLVSPAPFSDFFSAIKKWDLKLVARWSQNGELGENTKLELSKDKYFKKTLSFPLKQESNSEISSTVSLEEDGKWYWRIAENSKALSQERSFQLFESFKLEPSKPETEAALSSSQAKTFVSFSWKAFKGFLSKESKHHLELSTDPSFQKLSFRAPIDPSLGSSRAGPISYGRYYWRLTSEFQNIKETSDARSFSLSPRSEFNVSLKYPQKDSIQNIPKNSPVDFSWIPEEIIPDIQYEVEVKYLDQDGNEKVLKKSTPTNRMSLLLPARGKVEWKVLSSTKSLKLGESEKSRFFVLNSRPLTQVQPKPRESLYYWNSRVPIKFQWKNEDESVDIKYYVIELSPKADLSEKKSIKTRNLQNTFDEELGSGKYYWRVTGFDDNDNMATASDVREFQYGLHPKLVGLPVQIFQNNRSPSSVQDRNKLVFNIFKDPSPIQIELPHQEQKKVSIVRLFKKEKNQKSVILEKQITDNRLQLPKLKPGFYEISQTPIDILNRPGEESVFTEFELTLGPPLPAPRALSAEVQ